LIVAGLAAAPAWADLDSAHGERSDALVLALLLSGVALVCARRRVAIVGLALLLAVFAAESAVHSVHHLGGDSESAQSCAFSSSSQHVAGTCSEAPETGAPLFVSEAPPRLDQPVVRPLAAFFTEGRAPPALPVA